MLSILETILKYAPPARMGISPKMREYLEQTFGPPNKKNYNPKPSDIGNKQELKSSARTCIPLPDGTVVKLHF
mgnify:FL=1